MSYLPRTSVTRLYWGNDFNGERISYVHETESLYRAGGNTPGFRSYRRRHRSGLPINDLVVVGHRSSPGDSRTIATIIDNWGNITTQSRHDIPMGPTPTEDEVLKQKAYLACVSRMNSKMKDTDLNLAQGMGERKQVVDMIATTARRLASCYLSLHRGDWKNCVAILGLSVKYVEKRSGKAVKQFQNSFQGDPKTAAAGLWLEFQYGWRPLLSDIHEAAELVAKNNVRRENDSLFMTKTITAKVTLNKKHNVQKVQTADEATIVVQETAYTHRLLYRVRVENEFLRFSSQLGITNPALLAWELTPFSFVVDWFLPIGNYLSNAQAAWGLSFADGSSSVRYVGRTYGNSTTGMKTGGQVGQSKSQILYRPVEYFSYTRTPIYGFLKEPLPTFKSPVSLEHAANAVALLLQVFKKK